MEARRAELKKISSFIDNADKSINELLAQFGWDKHQLKTEEPHQAVSIKTAPLNDAFPESCYDTDSAFSLKLDKYTQEAIIAKALPDQITGLRESEIRDIPRNHDELITNFSQTERLILYEHIIKSTAKIEALPEIQIEFRKQDKDAKLTSLAEIAAYRRNVHRRNQKHRVAKNPLTYKEELRNLIQLQTEAMAEYVGQARRKSGSASRRRTDRESDHRRFDKHRRRSRSRSRRDESRSSSHRKRSRDRSRDRHRKKHRHD